MSPGMITFIIIVAIVTVGRIVRTGMALEGRKHDSRADGGDTIARLERENTALPHKVERIESRTAVLERIATDAPARLAAQIDEL